jgi:MFS transporter, NNP family, nitrate/nitrite transporter
MTRLDRFGLLAGGSAGAVVTLFVVIGSQGLRHFDPVLLPYALASIFAAAAVAYRYAVWLQRPPTWRYWQQGWRLFWQGGLWRNALHLSGLLFDNFATQRFIGQRSHLRWIMHLCLSWGAMLAFAITFPLVFGWIHFETPAHDPHLYQVFMMGMLVQQFAVDSWPAFLSFNALNLSAVLVLIGVALSLHRRLSEPGAMALQQFGNDVLPLLLLFIVATTGLGLTVSARWLHGHGFAFIALTHAAAVIAMLLYLPFGKFFHIFQRPAQLGVAFYKQTAQTGVQARCQRCGEAFTSQMQVDDLKQVLAELEFDYHLDGPVDHYQDICPPCRRKMLALNQGRTMQGGEAVTMR